MRTFRFLALVALLVSAGSGALAQSPAVPQAGRKTDSAPETGASGEVRQLEISSRPFKGDFEGMLERRGIRVYVPYSRSLYFIDKGRERGLAAELVRDFERWIYRKYTKKLGRRPITVFIGAATRDKLLGDLNEGLVDIAVGKLTVTEERLKLVDFVAPDASLVNVEILPGNISKMRREAAKRGLDPDTWFNNVERVTAAMIGVETTTYVRNIYKYYVSYKLAAEARVAAESAKESVPAAK